MTTPRQNAHRGLTPHPHLDAAQYAYMALTGVQISHTEVQRLHGALSGGASIKDAAQTVFDFFATPIDWDAERKAFAEWLKHPRGKVRGTVVVTMTRKV